MTTVHMDTEMVRDLARRLDCTAMDLADDAASVSSAAARLSWAWQSPRAYSYQQELRLWISRFQAHVYRLQYLGLRVSHEVDEWEIVDGSRPFSGILSPFYPGVISELWPWLLPGISGGFPWTPWGMPYPSALAPWLVNSSSITSYLPLIMVPLLPVTAAMIALDQAGTSSSGFFGLSGAFSTWTRDDGWQSKDPSLGVNAKVSLVDGAFYDAENAHGDVNLGGVDVWDYDGDVMLGHGDIGLEVGMGEDGFTAGAYGEFDAAKATGVAVLGSSMLGVTGTGTVKAGSVEGFVGIKDNTIGASIGGSIVSAEASAGVNIAGANVGVKGGISLGLEFGFKIGQETEVKFGPFKVGLSFGAAEEAG